MGWEDHFMRLPAATRRRPLIALVAIVGLVIAFAGGAYATHRFSDVPTSAFYHADVSWLADAGITTGCAVGKFCPNESVSRGQMAAFLHRLVSSTRVGHTNCGGNQFLPDAGGSGYGSFGSLRWRVSGSAVFRCNIVMPDSAVVTEVAFTVSDSSDSGEFEGGALFATNLVSNIGTEVTMGGVGGTGVAATPGDTTLTDTTITSPVVDNGAASYTALAILNGTTQSVGLWGVTVTYTYAGTPAP